MLRQFYVCSPCMELARLWIDLQLATFYAFNIFFLQIVHSLALTVPEALRTAVKSLCFHQSKTNKFSPTLI